MQSSLQSKSESSSEPSINSGSRIFVDESSNGALENKSSTGGSEEATSLDRYSSSASQSNSLLPNERAGETSAVVYSNSNQSSASQSASDSFSRRTSNSSSNSSTPSDNDTDGSSILGSKRTSDYTSTEIQSSSAHSLDFYSHTGHDSVCRLKRQ